MPCNAETFTFLGGTIVDWLNLIVTAILSVVLGVFAARRLGYDAKRRETLATLSSRADELIWQASRSWIAYAAAPSADLRAAVLGGFQAASQALSMLNRCVDLARVRHRQRMDARIRKDFVRLKVIATDSPFGSGAPKYTQAHVAEFEMMVSELRGGSPSFSFGSFPRLRRRRTRASGRRRSVGSGSRPAAWRRRADWYGESIVHRWTGASDDRHRLSALELRERNRSTNGVAAA